MKLSSMAMTAACAALLTCPLLSQERKSGVGMAMLPSKLEAPASHVMTDAQFEALRAASSNGQEQPKPLPPKKYDFSLVEMSTIVAWNDKCTLLPKGCVVACPEVLKTRIVSAPSGEMIPWQQFLTENRAWIATTDVEMKQVRGEKPLPDSIQQSSKSRCMMLVATINSCPVTVLPFSPDNLRDDRTPRPAGR